MMRRFVISISLTLLLASLWYMKSYFFESSITSKEVALSSPSAEEVSEDISFKINDENLLQVEGNDRAIKATAAITKVIKNDDAGFLNYKKISSLADIRTKAGFFENKGQLPKNALYSIQRGPLEVHLGSRGLQYHIRQVESKDDGNYISREMVNIEFENANPNSEVIALNASADVHNYLNRSPHVTGVHHYQQVIYKDLYPNIDVVFYAYEGYDEKAGLKYNFLIHPGGNPDDITLKYSGTDQLSLRPLSNQLEKPNLTPENRLLVASINGNLIGEQINESYTLKGELQTPVMAKYVLDNDKVKITTGHYDKSKLLVVDPDFVLLELQKSTYYGTEGTDRMRDVALDDVGNIYVVGVTSGDTVDISRPGAFQNVPGGNNDIIVAKFNAELDMLLAASYYGGNNDDEAFGIELDEQNNIFIAGYTESTDIRINNGTGTYSSQGQADILIARFSNDLSTLTWATALGGSGIEQANGLKIVNNNVAVVGNIESNGLSTIGGGINGSQDAFVATFNRGNGSLEWLRYFGGSFDDEGNGVAIANNNIYATGVVLDNGANDQIFITGYNLSGGIIDQNLYGTSKYTSKDISASTDGSFLVVVGQTDSPLALPNSRHQTNYNRRVDGFILKVNTIDLSVDWSSYYGGNQQDVLQAVEMDCNNNVNVSGHSKSPNTNNVIAENGFFNDYQGGGTNSDDKGDAILAKFSPDGERLWGSYFGNAGDEEGIGIAFDPEGNIILCGATTSVDGIATSDVYDSVLNANGKAGFVGFVSTFCDVIVTRSPIDQIAPIGADVNFTIDTELCGRIISYSWTKDGAPVNNGGTTSGADTDSLSLSAITFADEGEYCVTIQTSCGPVVRCAQLSIVELTGNSVCLDTASVLSNPSINQDTITLSFVDFDANSNITNATYQWNVVPISGPLAGANRVVDGSQGPFPFDLPMTSPRADLFEIKIVPSAPGQYRYILSFEYDDSRRTPTRVSDDVEVIVNVFPFPSITNISPDPVQICENETADITITTDIAASRITYERIDSNTGLVGNPSGTINLNPANTQGILSLNGFSNNTNQSLSAVYRFTPFSEENCIGPTRELTVEVRPNPEFTVTVVRDTICDGSNATINFAALTSPINYQANGGTTFTYERVANPNISPAPSGTMTVTNSGSVDESLNNTSNAIQEVTYNFTAEFNGCTINFSEQVYVLPQTDINYASTTIEECSGDDFIITLSSGLNNFPTTIELVFQDNPNVIGERDTTFEINAGAPVDIIRQLI
ncbi:MAG: SBBP repeat-containing protein, partial [Bacteroidota bacterium]